MQLGMAIRWSSAWGGAGLIRWVCAGYGWAAARALAVLASVLRRHMPTAHRPSSPYRWGRHSKRLSLGSSREGLYGHGSPALKPPRLPIGRKQACHRSAGGERLPSMQVSAFSTPRQRSLLARPNEDLVRPVAAVSARGAVVEPPTMSDTAPPFLPLRVQ